MSLASVITVRSPFFLKSNVMMAGCWLLPLLTYCVPGSPLPVITSNSG